MHPLLRGFEAATRPRDRRTPWQWCEEHVEVDHTSPMPGRWRSDSSPWVKEFMEEFADNTVSIIVVRCSAQSSKTQTLINLLCWAIAEDPGPAQWVMAAKDEAKVFVRDRVDPTLKGCDPVMSRMVASGTLDYTFTTMPLYFVGAGSPSKLQSKPIRWLLLDEVRNYPPGALEMVMKRTRAFSWNSRTVMLSTADLEDDTVDREYKAGDQRVWHFPCPKCGASQPLRFEQVKWDSNDRTRPDGKWNFDRLAESIRYECVDCKYAIHDTPAERKWITRMGKFVRMNPDAPHYRVSFTWNALLPPWVSWRSIVEEFIAARAAAKGGDIEPMRAFVNETLGESWRDELGEVDDYDFLKHRQGDYDYGEPWAEERVRFMAADRQQAGGEHYWWAIRAFGLFGKSRLVAYGRCNTTEELEETRRTYGVKQLNCMVDSGFKASEVYKFCSAAGWKAFKGEDAEHFITTQLVPNPQGQRVPKSVRTLWQKTLVDPAFGTRLAGKMRPIPLFRWSNPSTKDLLATYMQGLVGEWTLPRKVGADYLRQITAERRREHVDPRGRVSYLWHQVRRDNHLLDCELMILAAAVITGIVKARPLPGPAAGGEHVSA